MPGMDTTAPDRTATRSGFVVEPKPRPVRCSRRRSESSTWSHNWSGHCPPAAVTATHAWVVTMNPSGTGTPSRVISATPAPLPPNNDFMDALPSAMS